MNQKNKTKTRHTMDGLLQDKIEEYAGLAERIQELEKELKETKEVLANYAQKCRLCKTYEDTEEFNFCHSCMQQHCCSCDEFFCDSCQYAICSPKCKKKCPQCEIWVCLDCWKSFYYYEKEQLFRCPKCGLNNHLE